MNRMDRRGVSLAIFMVQMFLRLKNHRGVAAAFLSTEWSVSTARSHRVHASTILLQQSRLFSQTSDMSSFTFPSVRAQVLHEQLCLVGVNADDILKAALRSIEEPTSGYDSHFGKPAIRAYRAFIFPKKKNSEGGVDDDAVALKAAAGRTARQVDFLVKRHQSHHTEWIRHHDVIRDRRQVFPLILVLDNLRSAFNVGSLYRTADAAGCQAVYTCGITPHPSGNGAEKIAKSALGAEHVLDTIHFATTREAIEYLRTNEPDYTVVGMETTDHSVTYTDVAYTSHPKIALVLGNEVTGVDTTLLPDMDQIVEIPTFGAKNSLNVAACAPVVLYEILRQWNV
jgi:23S rRNA (guanosine2251-2'-O)-methyltransferase